MKSGIFQLQKMCVKKIVGLKVLALVLVLNVCLLPVDALNEIDKLLEEGRKRIDLSENIEIVFVLGNTGAGKFCIYTFKGAI